LIYVCHKWLSLRQIVEEIDDFPPNDIQIDASQDTDNTTDENTVTNDIGNEFIINKNYDSEQLIKSETRLTKTLSTFLLIKMVPNLHLCLRASPCRWHLNGV